MIVGVARVGKYASPTALYYVVSWAGGSSPYRVLVRNGHQDPAPTVAANGDITYSTGSDLNRPVQRPSGALVHLGGVPGQETHGVEVAGSAGTWFYGTVRIVNTTTIARWNMANVPASGVVPAQLISPIGALDWLVTVGARGDVVALLRYATHSPTRQTATYAWRVEH